MLKNTFLNKEISGKTKDVRMSFNSEQLLYTAAFEALGCPSSIIFGCKDRVGSVRFVETAIRCLVRFEERYSRYRESSIVSKINRCAGKEWVEIDEEFEAMLRLCDDLHFMTHGILDPTALPLIQLWDFKNRSDLPSELDVARAMEHVGWEKVERRRGAVYLPYQGMALDFGGFGKEYAADQILKIAVDHGIGSCLVDLGKDLCVLGKPPKKDFWNIALEDPRTPGKAWIRLACVEGGIATSGDYRRFFEIQGKRYGHIIDPRSGRPVTNEILSVSVLANSCLEAGMLSTASFVLGQDDGMDLVESTAGASACFVREDGIFQSTHFHRYCVS